MSPPKTIIVVDDNASMRQAIERLLGAAGWQTLTFSSGEELLESGAANQASGFILDVRLSGISGFELSAQLETAGVSAPFIFITAYDQPAARSEAKQRGAAGFFIKPFPGGDLIAVLNHHLQTT